MQCPRCDIGLSIEIHKGIEVDRCKNCDGIWLDHHELDQLEDTIFDKDSLKGMEQYNLRPLVLVFFGRVRALKRVLGKNDQRYDVF